MALNVAALLSGGMDSIALTYWKKPAIAVTIDYGQLPAFAEIEAAATVCSVLNIRHEVVRVDCSQLGSGDLAGRPASASAPVTEWWPFRNQILITIAAMRLIDAGIGEIMIGSVATDSSHADGTPQFFARMAGLLCMQEGGLTVSAPAIAMTSQELIEESKIPASILAWAHSCHIANVACGRCRGCLKHQQVTAALRWPIY